LSGATLAITIAPFKPLFTRKCSELHATLMIYVHSLTRLILIRLILQMLCRFYSSCRPLYRRLAPTRLHLGNRADVEDRSARRTKRRRQHVVQSQAFRKTLNANRLWLEQPPIRFFCFFNTGNTITIDMICCLHTTLTTVITE
jgi:hypothetical protein